MPRIEIIELAAAAGFDLVILDCEHGPFGIESLPPLIAAGKAAGLYVVVRVADEREQGVGAVLDAGADGVLVPHIDSGGSARAAVSAARFPPHGERSVNPWVRGAQYGADADYALDADENTAVMVLAEGPDAIRNLPDLLGTADLDAIFVGTMDLAATMGLLGQSDHPEVRRTAREVLLATAAAGKAGAIFAPTPMAAREWLSAGARLVVMSVDTAIIARGFADILSELKESSGGQVQ